MEVINFFRITLSNVKCAFCRKKNCKVRFLPGRRKYTWVGGTRYVSYCVKDLDKKIEKVLK